MKQAMKPALFAFAVLGVLAAAAPARADVKAGVDAWTRGDYAAAVREWVGPAQQGDPDAQFNLAQAYRLGRGVDPDPKQAEALYERAAAQGHVKAADNFGLLLFQRGERERAMPYVMAAAMRGDPRSQYLLGIAHFNGDLAQKDWRRAYALLTLANSAGLPQAGPAIQQMDQHIPLEDRQAAQLLAASLKAESDAARARDLAAVDLALGSEGVTSGVSPAPPPALPSAPSPTARPAQQASVPQHAGADYTLPQRSQPVVVARTDQPVRQAPAIPAPARTMPSPAPTALAAPADGPWKVQLGAFGVPANADRLWSRLAGRSELAGKTRLKLASGSLTRLLAGGYASRAQAEAACASLKRSGHACLVTQ
ncbi:MAG: SPOR domain-containing protein [Erythrobacter sp.]|jgi:cell division septation protein DedD